MKLLLDTCALLALAGQAGKLPRQASQALASPGQIGVSPVSAWEIAIKVRNGKLHMGLPPHDWFVKAMERYHLEEIPLDTALLCAAADLPLLHRDPFDRVLVATCLAGNFTLLTSDPIIPTYPGMKVIW